jgi:hypothetical protein
MRRLLRWVTVGDRDDAARDLEISVLRHQVHVLSRGRRLPLRRRDRILLAAASSLLPRARWRCFLVTRGLFCAGIANSSDASGLIEAIGGRVGRELHLT